MRILRLVKRSDLTEASEEKALNQGSPGRLSPFIWLKLESFGNNLGTEMSRDGTPMPFKANSK